MSRLAEGERKEKGVLCVYRVDVCRVPLACIDKKVDPVKIVERR